MTNESMLLPDERRTRTVLAWMGLSVENYARQAGISTRYLWHILKSEKVPSQGLLRRLLLPIRLIDSDGRRLDDEHQTDGSEGHRRLMAIRKKDRRGTECGWASSRRKPEIGGR